MMSIRITLVLLLIVRTSFAQWPFEEEGSMVNVHARHFDPKLIGGGVVVFDYNNDGHEDLYFTGGLDNDQLFRNKGNGQFENVSSQTGIIDGVGTFKTVGAVSGDLDNDGFEDLVVTTDAQEPNIILKNVEGMTFEVLTPFPDDPRAWSSSVLLSDCDQDGDLDIYILNYVGYDQEPYFQWRDRGLPNVFYQNNGNFQFSDITNTTRTDNAGAGLAGAFSDFDNDDDDDLFVINDFGYEFSPNTLYVNQFPEIEFSEVAQTSPASAAIDGMGIAIGDYNGDGRLDYYVSNFLENLLLTNLGNTFEESAAIKGVEVKDEVSWGTFFFDFDNDSYPDLFVANGSMLDANAPQDNRLFRQNMDGQFVDVTPAGLIPNKTTARGAACGDLNNDGYPDVIVATVTDRQGKFEPALVYMNHSEAQNHWLKLKLEGTLSNRDAYGAKIRLYIKDRVWLQEIAGGSSYLSQNSSVAHFGLGNASKIDSLAITWPNGVREVYYDLEVNQYLKAVEQEGIAKADVVTGLSEEVITDIMRLSPNPFSDQIMVELLTGKSGANPSFYLYNVIGQQIHAIKGIKKSASNSFILHIDPCLPADIYLLMIVTGGKSSAHRIIKQ